MRAAPDAHQPTSMGQGPSAPYFHPQMPSVARQTAALTTSTGFFCIDIHCISLLAALKHPGLTIWDCNGGKRDGVWHRTEKLNTFSPPWYVLKLQPDHDMVFLFLLLVENKANPGPIQSNNTQSSASSSFLQIH